MKRTSKSPTRAQENGVSTRLYRRRLNRKLGLIDDCLVEVGGMFGDIDQYVVNECDRLRDELLDLTKVLASAIRRLELPDGEEPDDDPVVTGPHL